MIYPESPAVNTYPLLSAPCAFREKVGRAEPRRSRKINHRNLRDLSLSESLNDKTLICTHDVDRFNIDVPLIEQSKVFCEFIIS